MEVLSTLVTILNLIICIATVLGLLPKLYKTIRKIENIKEDVYSQLNDVKEELIEVKVDSCKNYITRNISDIKQGKVLDEIDKERTYEAYDTYIGSGHNGYIKAEFEKLQKEGKI